ncbi:MAG: hypothetical protein KA085_00945 [Phenylobacterium sp.]|uniref:hypothetical protein n=1 Tax=Phenylobacterium sp. TaxID=1871053 RepID=UPI001B6F1379|nr:hypothetical protein [Phenylobacterium sp.]MBP7814663.1 hypothetical protein [Phenylobacterium sp.]MBP9755853.1 hypothetical protein [Phenylobacterium sp.]
MPTKHQQQAIQLYAELMSEAKVRMQWIAYAVDGKTGLDSRLVREFSYLQLRLICELIALGCLAAHGDVTSSTKIRKMYAADQICAELEKLHPNFYPKPHNQIRTGPNRSHFEDVAEPYLTRDDLKTLYAKTGGVLHKGNMKNILSGNAPSEKKFSEIVEWHRKIVRLLSIHRLSLFDGDTHFICLLQDSNTKGVRVVIANKVEDLGDGLDELKVG